MRDYPYIADTILVEQLYAAQFLTADPRYLQKTAGLADDLGLSGIASSIKDFSNHYLGEEIGNRGAVGGLLSLLSFPVLLRMNPLLGTVNLVASMFGWDLASIAERIIDYLKPKIVSGELTTSDIDQAGQEMVKGSFYIAEILKTAGPDQGFLSKLIVGDQKQSIITKIFGNLGKEKGWQFAKAILFWTIKTALIGAGMVAGANALGKYLGIKHDTSSSTQPQNSAPSASKTTNHLTPSGRGETFFANNEDEMWVVPVIDGSVTAMLAAWAVDVYPELAPKLQSMQENQKFQQTVALLETNYSASEPELTMPRQPLHTRKQVVDLFASQV